jgi:hypothetical protein
MSATLTLRIGKSSPLTAQELDNNFTALNGIINDPVDPGLATTAGVIPIWDYETENWKASDMIKVGGSAAGANRAVVINAPETGLLSVGDISTFSDLVAGKAVYCYGPHRNDGFASNSIFGDNSFTLTTNVAKDCNSLGRSNFVDKISGNGCTAVGYESSMNDLSGLQNTSIGAGALKYVQSSNFNVAIGFQALKGGVAANPNMGNSNIAIGRLAGAFLESGSNNTIIGSGTGSGTATMSSTLIMYAGESERLKVTTAGIRTNGSQSLTVDGDLLSMGGGSLTTNFAGGTNTLEDNTTGNYNTGVGAYSLKENNTGIHNTALGYEALETNTNGQGSTAIGSQALKLAESQAAQNIGIGWGAGESITTGTYNTIIGSSPGSAAMSGTVLISAGSTERIKVDANGLHINEKPVPIYDLEVIVEGETINNTTAITFTNFIPITVSSTVRWLGELTIETFAVGPSGTASTNGIPVSQKYLLNAMPGIGGDFGTAALAISGNGLANSEGMGTPFASTPLGNALPVVSVTGNEFGIQLTITGQAASGVCLQRATYRANDVNA